MKDILMAAAACVALSACTPDDKPPPEPTTTDFFAAELSSSLTMAEPESDEADIWSAAARKVLEEKVGNYQPPFPTIYTPNCRTPMMVRMIVDRAEPYNEAQARQKLAEEKAKLSEVRQWLATVKEKKVRDAYEPILDQLEHDNEFDLAQIELQKSCGRVIAEKNALQARWRKEADRIPVPPL